MANLKLSHIYKVYENGHKAVNDFSIDIADREFIVFVGPSGCGKSTTLRMVAGLETITAGDLFIGDTLVNDMEPKDRDIAMVFQSYALYPHMTVYENMAFGLRNRKMPEEEIKQRVLKAAKMRISRNTLTVSRRQCQVDRDSVSHLAVLSYVILKYSCWMNRFRTWTQNCVLRCVRRSLNSTRTSRRRSYTSPMIRSRP